MRQNNFLGRDLGILIILFSFMFQSYNSNAQILETKIGVRGGVNVSFWDKSEDVVTAKILPGYQVGAFLKLQALNHFAIQPELNFSKRGTEVTTMTSDNLEEVTLVDLKVIEVPVMAVININKFFNIQAGPYAHYRIDVSARAKDGSENTSFGLGIQGDDFKPFDIGLAAGMGIDAGPLMGGIRYYHGFNNITEDDSESKGISSPFMDTKNNVVELFIGIGF